MIFTQQAYGSLECIHFRPVFCVVSGGTDGDEFCQLVVLVNVGWLSWVVCLVRFRVGLIALVR